MTLNLNGWTYSAVASNYELVEVAKRERVNFLTVQDTRMTEGAVRAYRNKLKWNKAGYTIWASEVEYGEKMKRVGGTAILVDDKWKRYVVGQGGDDVSKTGMYTWVKLKFKEEKVIVISVYVPIPSKGPDTMYRRAQAELGVDPRVWLRRELERVLAEAADSVILIGGDLNTKFENTEWESWAGREGLKNVAVDLQILNTIVTFERSGMVATHPDHILVSEAVETKWVGVIEDDRLKALGPDHNPLKSKVVIRWKGDEKQAAKPVSSIEIRMTNDEGEESKEAKEFKRYLTEDHPGDSVEEIHEQILRAAKKVRRVHERKTKHWKDGWSPIFMMWHDWLTTLVQIRRATKHSGIYMEALVRGHVEAWEQRNQKWTGTEEKQAYRDVPTRQIRTQKGIWELRREVEEQRKKFKDKCHAKERAELRKRISERVKEIELKRKAGKISATLRAVLGRESREQITHIKMADGNVVSSGEGLHEVLTDLFKDWYAEDRHVWVKQLDKDTEAIDEAIQGRPERVLRVWRDAPVEQWVKEAVAKSIAAVDKWEAEDVDEVRAPVKYEEWEQAVKMASKNKASGRSRVTYNMLKLLPEQWKRALWECIREKWEKGEAPASWGDNLIAPIPKEQGNWDIQKLRPISLLEATRKVWMRVIWRRVQLVLNRRKRTSDRQYGFQKGRDTTQPIQQLISVIESNDGSDLHLVFVDFRRAFDLVPRKAGALMGMKRSGIPAELSRQISDIDNDGMTVLRTSHWEAHQGEAEEFKAERGVPQGSVESPGLFILFMDVLLTALDGSKVQVYTRAGVLWEMGQNAFADDVLLVARGEDEIKAAVKILTGFCVLFGMEINFAKTKYMVKGCHPVEGLGGVDADGEYQKFTYVQQGAIRYLGVEISVDGDLWKVQRRKTKKMVHQVCTKLRKRRESLEAIWLALRTVVYPGVVYTSKFTTWTDSELELLDKEIARLMKARGEKSRTVPDALIWADRKKMGMGLLPLSTFIRKEQLKVAMKGLNKPEWDGGATAIRFELNWGRAIQGWLRARGLEMVQVGEIPELKDGQGLTRMPKDMVLYKSEWGEWRKLQYTRSNKWAYNVLTRRGRSLTQGDLSGEMLWEDLDNSVEYDPQEQDCMGRRVRLTEKSTPGWVEEVQDMLAGMNWTETMAYTDGSVRRGRSNLVGAFIPWWNDVEHKNAAAAVVWSDERARLSRTLRIRFEGEQLGEITSYETETTALVAALLVNVGLSPNSVYSDSTSAVSLLQKVQRGTEEVAFWREIQRDAKETKIEWVRSHPEKRGGREEWTREERGNAKADEVASGKKEPDVEITYDQLVRWLSKGERWAVRYVRDKREVPGRIGEIVTRRDERVRWERYIHDRDQQTRRRRGWGAINWDLMNEGWNRTEEKPRNLQQRLNRLSYIMDWAPTGEWKHKKGYGGEHKCVCGELNPSRKHILTECTKIRSDKEDADLLESISERGAGNRVLKTLRKHIRTWIPWSKEKRFVPGRQMVLDWPEIEEVAEDLMCGCWNMKVVQQIAGEVEHELGSEDINRDYAPESVEEIHDDIVRVTAIWANYGFRTWRKYNENITRPNRAELNRERRKVQQNKRQRGLKRYMRGQSGGQEVKQEERRELGAGGRRPQSRSTQSSIDEWIVRGGHVP